MFRNLLISLTLVASSSWAAAIQPGQPLPPLQIDDKGELVITGKEEISFQPWSTQAIDTASSVQIIQHMAARPSAETQIRPFTDRLEAEGFPPELHHVSTVVNLSDVTFGASGWALSELMSNKFKHADSTMVADWNGKGLKTWGLTRKTIAITILDENGSVLFFKDGALTSAEIDQAIGLIRQEVEKRQTTAKPEVVDNH